MEQPNDLGQPITPLSVLTVLMFFQYLRYPPKLLSHSGIDNYRSALKMFYQRSRRCPDGWNESAAPHGNPVHSREVADYMTSIKKEDAQSTETKQSLPMTYNRLSAINRYLESESSRAHFSRTEALQLGALFSLAFICMLRIDEALSLKLCDVDFSTNSSTEMVPYITVHLIFRKTNQADATAGSRYKLYSNPKEEHADARKN